MRSLRYDVPSRLREDASCGRKLTKSIQTKFIALILGCTLLCAAVIGGAGILNANGVVDADSSRIMNLMCEEKAESIDAILSRIEQSVETLALYATDELDDVSRLRTDPAYVEDLTARIQAVAVNAGRSTDGSLAVYVRFNPNLAGPTAGLFWSRATQDGSFQPQAPTDLSRYGSDDLEHVGWYYLPVQSGKPIWLAPYFNKNLGVEMLSYVIPLYADGETVGVVGMDVDFSVIEDMVTSTHVYESGYAFLTDGEANVIFHRELQEGTPMGDLEESLVPVAEELQRGGNGSYLFPYTWRGVEKRMALCSLSNGMRLAITAPTAEIDAAKNNLIAQIVFFTTANAALSVVLAVALSRRIVRPLKELNVAARQVAEGDLSVELSSRTNDEVGTLALSFQQTVNHLRTYIDYINGLAYRDGLTGVKNKTAYQDAVKRLEEAIKAGKPEFGVIVFDINGLKQVNDTFGHDFGDMLIIDACRVICKVFKRSPVYRIGGDEFTVILEHADLEHCIDLLEGFERELEESNRYAHPERRVSIARGIAVYEEQVDLAFVGVFKRADEAMYRNKAAMKRREDGEGA